MEVSFVGVGEATDTKYPNTSVLIVSGKERLLIGAGYSDVQPFLRVNDGKKLNGIYVPNNHYSSVGGLGPLLTLLDYSVPVIFQDGMEKIIKDELENHEPGDLSKLDVSEVKPGDTFELDKFSLTFAYSECDLRNMAVRIDDGKKIVCYSGNGNFTKESKALYSGADLLIHEAYYLNKCSHDHSNLFDVIKMAEDAGVKRLAIVSLERKLRENGLRKVQELAERSNIKVLVPTSGFSMRV